MFVGQPKKGIFPFIPANPGKVNCSVEFTWEQCLCCGCDINPFITKNNGANMSQAIYQALLCANQFSYITTTVSTLIPIFLIVN